MGCLSIELANFRVWTGQTGRWIKEQSLDNKLSNFLNKSIEEILKSKCIKIQESLNEEMDIKGLKYLADKEI